MSDRHFLHRDCIVANWIHIASTFFISDHRKESGLYYARIMMKKISQHAIQLHSMRSWEKISYLLTRGNKPVGHLCSIQSFPHLTFPSVSIYLSFSNILCDRVRHRLFNPVIYQQFINIFPQLFSRVVIVRLSCRQQNHAYTHKNLMPQISDNNQSFNEFS